MLPQEILEAIIDAIAHDHELLFTLCLVCRAFVPRCRKHIFRTLDFDKDSAYEFNYEYPRRFSSRTQALVVLLQQGSEALAPPIGEYVRVLSISHNFSPSIIQIMARLPNLRSLIVKTDLHEENGRDQVIREAHHWIDSRSGGQRYDISEMPPGTVDDIHEWLESRVNINTQISEPQPPLHLERLFLKMKFPASANLAFNFISRGLRLQERNIRPDKMTSFKEVPSSPRVVTIRKLELHNATSVLKILLDMEHTRSIFTGLTSLSLFLHEDDQLEPALRLLSQARDSIQAIELIFSKNAHWAQVPNLLHLNALPKLKHLVLARYLRSPHQLSPYAIPEGITTLLSAYRSSPSLLETISITLPSWEKMVLEDDWDEEGTWSGLQRLLSEGVGFHALRSFRVYVNVRRTLEVRRRLKAGYHTEKAAVGEKAAGLLVLGEGVEGGIVFDVFQSRT